MQYKFFVDGQWRHDEHQRSVSGNYGVVNTVFVPRELYMDPPVFDLETSGSNMELDDVFSRTVRV